MAYRAQGVYFTLDAIYAIQEYGEGFHRLTDVSLWARSDSSVGKPCLQHKYAGAERNVHMQSTTATVQLKVTCTGTFFLLFLR